MVTMNANLLVKVHNLLDKVRRRHKCHYILSNINFKITNVRPRTPSRYYQGVSAILKCRLYNLNSITFNYFIHFRHMEIKFGFDYHI